MSRLTHETAFNLVHAHVAKWEGGYIDHPNDPGGVTMYGISLMFLKSLGLVDGDIDGDGDIDRNDVLAITRDTARSIFRRHFWEAPGAENLPPLVAMCFYDLAVNAGAGRAAIILQEGINCICSGAIPRMAPNIGPLTRTWSNRAATDGRQLELCHAYLNRPEDWYRRLAVAKPKSAVFLKGWLNRTSSCRDLIDRTAREMGVA